MAVEGLTARPSLRQLRANLPENVVILPTAAPRQVPQPTNRDGRLARHALRELSADHFAYKDPGLRKAERRAAILRNAGKTPGIVLAHAILAELDRETRGRVIGRLARSEGDETARAAFEFAQTTILNVGEQYDLLRAFESLDGL